MQAAQPFVLPERLRVVATLAQMLTALESAPRKLDAGQYRTVVQRLSEALAVAEPDEALDRLLAHFPAAADVYENLRYAQAGLCRHALEPAMNAEMQAREVLARAGRIG